jgi:hypothetical protein
LLLTHQNAKGVQPFGKKDVSGLPGGSVVVAENKPPDRIAVFTLGFQVDNVERGQAALPNLRSSDRLESIEVEIVLT